MTKHSYEKLWGQQLSFYLSYVPSDNALAPLYAEALAGTTLTIKSGVISSHSYIDIPKVTGTTNSVDISHMDAMVENHMLTHWVMIKWLSFEDDNIECILLNVTEDLLKSVLKCPLNNVPALVQIVVWRRTCT